MYEFLDRLVTIAMPRIRDFRGIYPRSFDGRGNYSLGVKEQIIFPEIQYDQIDQIRGMDITITTTAKDNKQGEPCSKLSISRSGSKRNQQAMAKTNMVEREKRRAKIVKQYAAKRAQLKELIRSPQDLSGGARRRAGEAAEAAARREPVARSQPLRDHGPLPRRVSQVRPGPREDPRSGESRRDARRVQGELVRSSA